MPGDEVREDSVTPRTAVVVTGEVPVPVVMVETGRNNSVAVPVGSPFGAAVDAISNEANYGGYYRVFLNGSEVIHESDAPEFIEVGQRIAITSYDKVG